MRLGSSYCHFNTVKYYLSTDHTHLHLMFTQHGQTLELRVYRAGGWWKPVTGTYTCCLFCPDNDECVRDVYNEAEVVLLHLPNAHSVPGPPNPGICSRQPSRTIHHDLSILNVKIYIYILFRPRFEVPDYEVKSLYT